MKKRSNLKKYFRESKYNPPISSTYKVIFFLFDLFLEARAEIHKYLPLFFGGNENFKKSFQN